MGIHESGENYLETILFLEKQKGTVRSVDIATALDFSKPSISRAMSILKTKGYITMERNGEIKLTESGRHKADQIFERHQSISLYLEKALGVGHENSSADACRIEHVISEESFEKIKEWVEKNHK